MSSLFLDAVHCKEVSRPPVWLMRQAGRYLPSYRKIREKVSLETMFTSPDLIEEVTLLPMEEIGPDAAIVFSDITIVALSLGLKLSFIEGKGPVTYPPIREEKDLLALKRPFLPLPFLEKAIASLKKRLDKPLIGFCGSPFTVACYLADKKLLYKNPLVFKKLLNILTELTKQHISSQIAVGVDALQIFDSSAYLLPRESFQTYSLPYMKELVDHIHEQGTPSIVFARGACSFKKELISLRPKVISYDWLEPLKMLRETTPDEIAIQGNFDPDLMYASTQQIEEEIERALPQKPGIIVNLGHGLKPDMDPKKIQAFVDVIKNNDRCTFNCPVSSEKTQSKNP